MTKSEQAALNHAHKKLVALTTTGPKGKACGIKDEHKEAVRLYVETWIIPIIEAVKTPSNERDYHQKNIMSSYR